MWFNVEGKLFAPGEGREERHGQDKDRHWSQGSVPLSQVYTHDTLLCSREHKHQRQTNKIRIYSSPAAGPAPAPAPTDLNYQLNPVDLSSPAQPPHIVAILHLKYCNPPEQRGVDEVVDGVDVEAGDLVPHPPHRAHVGAQLRLPEVRPRPVLATSTT